MKTGRFVSVAAAFLLAAAFGFSQGIPSASLTGKVTTEGGVPLPGVAVTVVSPSMQGTRDVTTSGNGDYIFNLLPSGEYTVKFALSGMSAVDRTVSLAAGAVGRVDVEMSPAAVAETVTVSGRAGEAAAVESPQVSANYTKEFVEKLPVGRTLAATTLLAPGVTNNGPGGNDRLSAIAISGAPSFDSLFLINGVVVNENLRGQPHDLFIEDAIQETTILTGAISAEYGRFTGGVVSAITKSGGNRVSGSFRTSFTNDKWSENDPLNEGRGVDSRIDKTNPVYEFTLGGPIWVDRIWGFGAYRTQETSTSRQTNPTAGPGSINPTVIAYENVRDQQRLEAKLTAALSSRHNVVGTYIDIQDEEVNNSFTTNILDTASLITRTTPNTLLGINYNGVLTDRLFIEAQYARKEFTFENSGSPFTDLIQGTLLLDRSRGQARFNSPTFSNDTPEQRDNESWFAKASYFLSTPGFGTHDIRVGYEHFHDFQYANNHQSGSDFRVFATSAIIRGTDVFPVFQTPGDSTFLRWTPIFEDTRGTDFNTESAFINDRIALGKHLSFNVGVRYDRNRSKNSEGFAVSDDSAWSPRIAAHYDVGGDGRFVFNAGYGQYVANLTLGVANSTSPAGINATLDWFYRGPCINCNVNAPTDELMTSAQAIQTMFDWFNSIGGTNSRPTRLVDIPGLSSRILENGLTSPNVKEYTVGVGSALGARGFARLDLIYRNWDDFYGSRIDLSTGSSPADQFGNMTDLALIGNDDRYDRKYTAAQTQLSYRFPFGVFVGGNYTWSRLTGNLESENFVSGPIPGIVGEYPEYTAFRANNPTGYLEGDQRHQARLWLGFDVPTRFADFNVTVLETYASGRAYNALGTIDNRAFVDNPGYIDPPAAVNYYFGGGRGAFRFEDMTRTDLALNVNLKIWKSLEVFLQPELLNVFNEDALTGGRIGIDSNTVVNTRASAGAAFQNFDPRTEPVEGTHYAYAATFGNAIGRDAYQLPRTFRFSVGLRF
ncbi:MAG TPA: carboxypeptidase regulatory-like domain-containing protein [Thermoanaerobaculia bacterium]|nr:carboxypeptidase regulatory-like domain-containing protein [Thermoanaerobaculia bacterium]